MSSPDQLILVLFAFSGWCVTPMFVCWPLAGQACRTRCRSQKRGHGPRFEATSARLEGVQAITPHAARNPAAQRAERLLWSKKAACMSENVSSTWRWFVGETLPGKSTTAAGRRSHRSRIAQVRC